MFKRYFQKLSKDKLIIILLVVLLCAAIGGICYLFFLHKQKERRIENLSKVTTSGQAVIYDTIRDKQGNLHTIIKEVPVETEAEKRIAVGGYIDTVSTALKVAVSKIDELTKVNETLTARNKLLETMVQTTGTDGKPVLKPVKVHKDDFLFAQYDPEFDSLYLEYKVALNTAKYTKRKNIFSQKQTLLNIWSDDPRVTINGVKRFNTDVTQKPKRFSIGPNISYSYNLANGKWQPAIGVGVQYNLIRF